MRGVFELVSMALGSEPSCSCVGIGGKEIEDRVYVLSTDSGELGLERDR